MRPRVAATVAAVAAGAVLAGCAGTDASGPVSKDTAVTPKATAGPTQAQLAYRKELLEQIAKGTFPRCGCTAELRAKERIASGKAKRPHIDQTVTAQP